MNEYAFLKSIFSTQYKTLNQRLLLEEGMQKARIDSNGAGLSEYTLYRFDTQGDHDILPFFDDSDYAPKNLRAFCDYVLLAELNDKLYVLLIELKSGDTSHAHKQLDASECFIDYVVKSAERIKDYNRYSDFSTRKIALKKIVLRPIKGGNRPTTKMHQHNQEQDYYTYNSNVFDIVHICRM